MNNTSRVKTVYINSLVTLVGQTLQILLGFVIRKLFIHSLGVAYLGYNSVFSNILQMLNLADLGIGIAITSFLYKPLAVNDRKRIAGLMYLYRRIYQILGLAVLIIGIIFSFFIQYLISDAECSIWYLRGLFYMNLAGTVSTYYLAYKRTLLIADQKSYVTSFIDLLLYLIMTLLQGAILLRFPNYVSYLFISVFKNIVSNIIISIKYNKLYGYYKVKAEKEILMEYKPQIISYVKDVFVAKIGSYVYYSTDNIIISIFKGSLLTGYLSNYTLVTTQINNIVTQILSSIQATFGNYISLNEDTKKQKKMTDNYLCVNFCIGNFCMLCIMFLIQPFIQLVFGKKLLLSYSTAIWLSVNLLLTILIQIPAQVFMIYKLYRYDRPIVIISAGLNIVVSTVLVKPMGINGVLLGTFITSIFYLFSRFYIISKYVYKVPYHHYVGIILRYGLITLLSILVEYIIVRNINGLSVVSFLVRMVLVGITALTVPTACLIVTEEFKFLKDKLIPIRLKRYFSNRYVLLICLLLTLLMISIGGEKR